MKHAIIFEGGGMRGAFTAGVIDQLIKENLYFDMVYGVSAGAGHACSYLTKQFGRAYAVSSEFAGDKRFCSAASLRETGDLFNAEFIYHEIPEKHYRLDNEVFLESDTRFRCVVTNCVTGQPEYPEVFDLYEDMEYVRASSSLPMLANMVPIDGKVYLDGGITDGVPVMQAEKEGFRKNVVVLTRPRGYRKKSNSLVNHMMSVHYRKYPNLVQAMKDRADRYNLTMEYIEEQERQGNLFVIAPMGPLNIGRTEQDKEKLRKAYQEGLFVTEGLMKKLIPFLSGE